MRREMIMSKGNSSSNNVGFTGLLFIVFLVLKLTGVISWSWWWITAPLWGTFALLFIVLGIVVLWVRYT
jgi:hypothetical protein